MRIELTTYTLRVHLALANLYLSRHVLPVLELLRNRKKISIEFFD